MRKLGALFHNEMLKSRKKISVFIIVIVMTVGMIGCSAFMKETNHYYMGYPEGSYDAVKYNIEYAESLQRQIQQYEKMLEDETLPPTEAENLKMQLFELKTEYVNYDIFGNYAKENKIGELSYRYTMLAELVDLRNQMLKIEFYNGDLSAAEYQTLRKQYEELDAALKLDDYGEYIRMRNQQIQADSSLSDAQKDAMTSYNETLLKLCPTGQYASYQEKNRAETLLSEKSLIDASLRNNVDLQNGGNLTKERRAVLEKDQILVNAKIEKGFLQEEPDNTPGGESYVMASSLGFIFVIIILIILAGSMMSHEMSTGTIKSLIIAPVKRWKFFAAKYLSLIVTMLFLILYTYGVASLTNGLLFGFDSFGDKIFLVSGRAAEMNYFLYQFLSALCNIVPLLIFTTLAYLLSIVTKNTAASVSVTIGLYLGGSFLHLLVVSGLSGYAYLVKFLPFSNLGLFEKIFYTTGTSQNIGGMLFGNIADASAAPLVFSVIYIIIILICMVSVGLDHFCRRDIK